MRVVVAAVVAASVMMTGPAGAANTAWAPSLPPTGVGFYAVSLFDNGVGYVYNRQPDVPGSQLFRTTDSGVTYNRVTTQSSVGTLDDVEFATPSTAFALSARTVLKSADGAATFDELTLPAIQGASLGLHALSARGADTVSVAAYVAPKAECGDNSKRRSTAVLTSTNGGASWTTAQLSDELRVRDLVVEGDGTGAMVTHGLHVTSEPTTTLGVQGCSYSFNHTGPGHVWLTDDAGKTFHPVFECPAAGCTQVARPSPNHVVIAAGDGTVATSTDGGHSFSTVSVAPRDALESELWGQGLEFIDGQTALLSTGTGIYRTDDGGATWNEEASPQKTVASGKGDLAVTPSGGALVGGASGVLRRVPLG